MARYIVGDWNSDDIIKSFDSEEDRQEWLDDNVTFYSDGGFLEDGRKVEIYEL